MEPCKFVLVPSTGFSYLNRSIKLTTKPEEYTRSRPLIGVLLSQYSWEICRNLQIKFSSPYRGSLISMIVWILMISASMFSSPYRGSLISIMKWNIVHECDNEFSSPYRGSLISIEQSFDTLRFHIPVLVPLSGFSYLNRTSCSRHSRDHHGSRPLIGVLLSQ